MLALHLDPDGFAPFRFRRPDLFGGPAQRGLDARQPEGARDRIERGVVRQRIELGLEGRSARPGQHPIFEQFVQPRPVPARIGRGAQRVERRQAEHPVGIKGKGIARQPIDSRNADPARAVGGGRRGPRLAGGLRIARRQVELRREPGQRHPARCGFGQRAAERREPQPEAGGDRGIAAAARRARHDDLLPAERPGEIMRRHPLLPLGRGQAQQPPDPRREPGVGGRRGGPSSFVEPAEDHQVGALQPRFEQAPDEQAGMSAIGRPDAFLRQQLPQHVGEILRLDERRPVTAGQRPAVEQAAERPAGRPGPDAVAREPAERRLQGREQGRGRRGRGKGSERLAERRRQLVPPGLYLCRKTMAARLGVRHSRRDPLRNAVPAGHQPRFAQQQVEPPDLIEPAAAFAACADQRMPEQGDQRHRIERRRQLGEQQQQRAGRRPRQGLTGAVVNRYAPARQRRRDALAKRAIGGHQRRGPARRLDRLAHQECDALRLLPVVGEDRAGYPGQRLRQVARRLPFDAIVGGREEQRNEGRARLRPVEGRSRRPLGHLAARHAHTIEQQFQMILRMRFQRPRRIVGIGTQRAERLPFARAHRPVEPRQHDHAALQIGDVTQQPRDRGRRRRHARRDDEPRRGRRAPCRAHAVEQAVAPFRPIDGARPRQRRCDQ